MEPTIADRLLVAALAFGAGLGLGLLFAPAEGGEARRRLAGSARDAAHSAQRFADPLAQAAKDHAAGLAQRHLPLADDLDLLDARDLPDRLPPAQP